MIVHQTPQQLVWAREWSDRCLAAVEGRPNYTGVSAPDRYYIGYRGEIAAYDWLRSRGVKVQHVVRTNGRSERPELIVDVPSGQIDVEVKTSGRCYHQQCRMPAVQKTDFNVLIGVRLMDDERARIMGWLGSADVAKHMRFVEDEYGTVWRTVDYGSMRDPDDLIRMLNRVA